MRLIKALSAGLPLLLCTVIPATVARELPPCLMTPSHISMPLPEEGFIDMVKPEMAMACAAIPANSWSAQSSTVASLFVNANGPSGSGRYWKVTVGIGDKGGLKPLRGICLQTSTIGWRTLQEYKTPLPWLSDRDGDGESELTIWSSFPITDGETPEAFGLVAWVYRLVEQRDLILDQALSKQLALDIAKSYRNPLSKDEQLKQLRERAAKALEAFGSGRCVVR